MYSTVNAVIMVVVFLVYTVAIGDIIFFVDIVASGYNVAHVYKALVNTTIIAPCVYIVAIGLILYN